MSTPCEIRTQILPTDPEATDMDNGDLSLPCDPVAGPSEKRKARSNDGSRPEISDENNTAVVDKDSDGKAKDLYCGTKSGNGTDILIPSTRGNASERTGQAKKRRSSATADSQEK